MQIYKDGETINDKIVSVQELDILWKEITKKILNGDRYIKFVEINNVPFYDGYELQIVKDFDSIKSLNIVTITASESLQESLYHLNEYIRRVLNELPGLYQPLYSELETEQWEKLIVLLEGIEWVVQTIEFSIILINQTTEFTQLKIHLKNIQNNFQEHFVAMDQLLKEEDLIGFADVLQYEIEPILFELSGLLTEGETIE